MGFPNEEEKDYPTYNEESIPLGAIKFEQTSFTYDNKEFRERLEKQQNIKNITKIGEVKEQNVIENISLNI